MSAGMGERRTESGTETGKIVSFPFRIDFLGERWYHIGVGMRLLSEAKCLLIKYIIGSKHASDKNIL